MDKQTLVKRVNRLAQRFQNYRLERDARQTQGINGSGFCSIMGEPLQQCPKPWEIEQVLSEVSNFLGYEEIQEPIVHGSLNHKCNCYVCIARRNYEQDKIMETQLNHAMDYTMEIRKQKDQHITDLQTRNTDLVEQNRILKSKLIEIRSLTL